MGSPEVRGPTFDLSVAVRRPPEAVLALLADIQDAEPIPRDSGITMVKDPPGMTHVGTRWHERVEMAPGCWIHIESTVTDVSASRLAMDFRSRWFTGNLSYDLERTLGGSVLHQRENLRCRALVRPLEPVILRRLRPRLEQRLLEIQALLESGDALPRTRPASSGRPTRQGRVEQVAEDVYRVPTGRGWLATNVYLVGTRDAWVLVDFGWGARADVIEAAATSVFGAGARPVALLMTHLHPDHVGSAVELCHRWGLRVWLHPAELPLAQGYQPQFANPLDRWVVGPAISLLPTSTRRRLLGAGPLAELVQPFDPTLEPPGMPGWEAVHTPGHTPGHVAFFRARDGVVITGDAVLTVDLNSPWGRLRSTTELFGPPRYSTWRWPAAVQSVAELAARRPGVLAPGHGRPLAIDTAAALDRLAHRLAGPRSILPHGFFRAVDYAGEGRYRRPPAAYVRMQWLAHLLTALGLSPEYAVTLEVPGRRSGVLRRTTLVQTSLVGQHYLVALAGESEWVRNVRAAHGRVVIGRRRRRAATLVEVAPQGRPEVIRAYLLRGRRQPGSTVVAAEARSYFGVSADPTLAEIEAVADRYPVFRIVDDGPVAR